MAGTVNKVILIGHLGDDVKMYYFDGGNSIGHFSIATNDSYTNRQTGEKIISTEWHNIVVRNKLAEVCEKFLTKGDKIYCEGRLKTRQWEQDGQKRYTTEIHVQEMTFLSTRKDREENSTSVAKNKTTQQAQVKKTITPEEDNLPF